MRISRQPWFAAACAAALSLSLANNALAEEPSLNAEELKKLRELYVRPADILYPKENPYSATKAELGKTLFFDPRLSASGTQSCATCHNPALGWQDGMPLGTGHEHKKLGRHTPTILNLAWDDLYFWDGRAASLEEQAVGPMASSKEMNMNLQQAETIVSKIGGYAPKFKAAFPDSGEKIDISMLAKAIATYERTVISAEAPFDKWIKGDESAISESAKHGFVLFNKKANCAACHSSWKFSDSSFQDIGLADADEGRYKILDLPAMKHAFKTVGLRNIAQRAPYMHDGSLATLEDVIEHYNKGGAVKRESLSSNIKPLHLTAEEKKDLVAFLNTLTSQDEPVTIPQLPK